MANRYAYNMQSFDRQVKKLIVVVDIVSGASTVRITNNSGVASVTEAGSGVYDLVFTDAWNEFLGMTGMMVQSSPDGTTFAVNAVDTQAKTLQLTAFQGTAGDPADGTMYLEFTMKNSSVR